MPHLEESVANGDNQPSRTVGVGAMGLDSWSELEVDGEAVQCLRPSRQAERFEGLASPSGHILAAATADTNAVLLFRRKPDGLFEEAPYCRIGSGHPLEYPHDVAFSGSGDIELLAVAQRAGSIVVFKKNKEDETFGPQPAFEICGPRAGLAFSDGVAFVPPDNEYLAACNLTLGSVTFYRRVSINPVVFEVTPEFVLKNEEPAPSGWPGILPVRQLACRGRSRQPFGVDFPTPAKHAVTSQNQIWSTAGYGAQGSHIPPSALGRLYAAD